MFQVLYIHRLALAWYTLLWFAMVWFGGGQCCLMVEVHAARSVDHTSENSHQMSLPAYHNTVQKESKLQIFKTVSIKNAYNVVSSIGLKNYG